MTHTRRRLFGSLSLFPWLLLACSDAGSSSPLSGSDESHLATSVDGSYELSFATTEPALPDESSFPSLRSSKARLDIRRVDGQGSTYEATLTGRWGASARYSVVETDDALTLTAIESPLSWNSMERTAGCLLERVVEAWPTLTLPRAPDGNLTGVLHGVGRRTVDCDDIGQQDDLKGTGTVTLDETGPEFRVKAQPTFGEGAPILPWDELRIEAAEPVDEADLRGAISLKSSSGTVLPLQWANETSSVATAVSAHIEWSGWPTADIHSVKLDVAGPQLHDLAGNAAAAFSEEIPLLTLSTADDVSFDGADLGVMSWGGVDHLKDKAPIEGPDDPRCESGGCLRLRPTCHSGIATLFPRKASATRIELRFRVIADAEFDDFGGTKLSLQAAVPDRPLESLGIDSGHGSALDSPIDSMTHGSDWTTVTMPIPAGEGPVGVSVQFDSWCMTTPTLPPAVDPVGREVVVESIRLQ